MKGIANQKSILSRIPKRYQAQTGFLVFTFAVGV
jgi:hypothetical protein